MHTTLYELFSTQNSKLLQSYNILTINGLQYVTKKKKQTKFRQIIRQDWSREYFWACSVTMEEACRLRSSSGLLLLLLLASHEIFALFFARIPPRCNKIYYQESFHLQPRISFILFSSWILDFTTTAFYPAKMCLMQKL